MQAPVLSKPPTRPPAPQKTPGADPVSQPAKRGLTSFLQEFSIPLIAGVFVALLHANLAPEAYEHVVEWSLLGGRTIFGHELTFHFLVNDIFMVLFFGLAAKEITEAALPGGSLNPIGKAINPLLATAGGVLGPIGVFLVALHFFYGQGAFPAEFSYAQLARGWGVPTATDIALAWLVARAVFGAGHPAVSFLLLLAVADDAIGLVIIAAAYGDPQHPTAPVWLLLVALAMGVAYALRRAQVRSWYPYVLVAGPLSWSGLVLANLHPALALVFVVPFLPAPAHDTGLFIEQDEVDRAAAAGQPHGAHSPLHSFGHDLKLFVDLGLFFFAYVSAGVELAGIGALTWIIFASLAIGKTLGITLFGFLGARIGFPLPDKMGLRELAMAGFVGGLGLTVALFVAGAAYDHPHLLGEAKMGALFSAFVGVTAVLIARPLGIKKIR